MKITKKILAAFLAVLFMLTGLAGLGVTANAAYSVGDTITFGMYPQAKVTDEALLASLNAKQAVWRSYGYYSGMGNNSDGRMTASDYMQYCDVALNGETYRGVRFTQYRPKWTGQTRTAANSYQDNNGYSVNTVYWFRYQPLQWRVLDPGTGLVLCTCAIDSQAYHNYALQSGSDAHGYPAQWGSASKTSFACRYEKSSIRSWLNNDFYSVAFSAEEQALIRETTLNNSCVKTLNGVAGYAEYDAPATVDKVFLLSYSDVKNPAYGFSADSLDTDPARLVKGTDYAECQGLYVADGCSYATLRTANIKGDVCVIYYNGTIYDQIFTPYTASGVCPAVTIDLAHAVASIRIKKLPAKTVYTYRRDTNIDLTGMELEVVCLNGKTETVTDLSGCTVTGYSARPAGEKTITVEYGGQTVQFTVTVKYALWQWAIRIFLLGFLWY